MSLVRATVATTCLLDFTERFEPYIAAQRVEVAHTEVDDGLDVDDHVLKGGSLSTSGMFLYVTSLSM